MIKKGDEKKRKKKIKEKIKKKEKGKEKGRKVKKGENGPFWQKTDSEREGREKTRARDRKREKVE